MKSNIAGEFEKIAYAEQVNILLQRESPMRPEARFNRRGQDALYLSVNDNSARVAMKKYANDRESPRVLIRYEVPACELVDLRHSDAKELRERASQDWKSELENGLEPTSWRVADSLRNSDEIGFIDPSRKNPKLWHVTLFRWNEAGAPNVNILGRPKVITL